MGVVDADLTWCDEGVLGVDLARDRADDAQQVVLDEDGDAGADEPVRH